MVSNKALRSLWAIACLCGAAVPSRGLSGAWPGEYTVDRQDAAGTLTLSTPYYTFRHDLKHGAELSLVAYQHGSSPNLLVNPMDASVVTPDGESFRAQNDTAPEVVVERSGKARVVRVASRLLSADGKDSGIRLRTRYEYRWG